MTDKLVQRVYILDNPQRRPVKMVRAACISIVLSGNKIDSYPSVKHAIRK